MQLVGKKEDTCTQCCTILKESGFARFSYIAANRTRLRCTAIASSLSATFPYNTLRIPVSAIEQNHVDTSSENPRLSPNRSRKVAPLLVSALERISSTKVGGQHTPLRLMYVDIYILNTKASQGGSFNLLRKISIPFVETRKEQGEQREKYPPSHACCRSTDTRRRHKLSSRGT